MVDISESAKMNWKGKWIWLPGSKARTQKIGDQRPLYQAIQPNEMNKFVLFRKKFVIRPNVKRVIIYLSVDSRYRLFINEKYVGRGINRCEAYYWYYNSYDITDLVKEGENIMSISARFYGRELAFYNPPELAGNGELNSGKGGLIFDINVQYEGSQDDETIGSDETTKVCTDPSQDSKAPNKGGLGYAEIVDLRKKIYDWTTLNCDDHTWEDSKIYDYPIKTLIVDPNQKMLEKLEAPAKILLAGLVEDCYAELDEEEKQSIDYMIQNNFDGTPEPLPDNLIENIEVFVGKEGVCTINPVEEGKAISILLQYDSMMVGYPKFRIQGNVGTIIDIINVEKVIGNSIDSEPIKDKRGCRVILSGGNDEFEQWEYEGYLYQQIKIRNITGPIKIEKFESLRTSMLPERYGKFECSDTEITELWNACAFTLLCCATDAYMDCPQREQRCYVGDAFVEALVSQVCFGTSKLTKKLIYDVAFGQRRDGITFSYHPGDYLESCHIIPDYTLYWIQLTEEYYLWSKEEKILFDLYPHFLLAIQWFLKYIDPKIQLLRDVPYWIFIDWAYDKDKGLYNAIFNTQFIDSLRIVAKIAKMVGDTRNERQFTDLANNMTKQINKLCWDSNEGCYRDSTDGIKPTGLISQHTNAYLSIKNIASGEMQDSLLHRVFLSVDEEFENFQINKDRPKRIDLSKLKSNNEFILYGQPFFMVYIHKFLDSYGLHEMIFRYFKKGWIPMLKEGKTKTIWETWSPKQSECHAWSATPAYDLSTYWLGVRPLTPGFLDIIIQPSLYGMEWAKGVYPTMNGDISIEWKSSKKDEKDIVEFFIDIPKTIKSAKFILPDFNEKSPINVKFDRKDYLPIKGTVELINGKNIIKIFY